MVYVGTEGREAGQGNHQQIGSFPQENFQQPVTTLPKA